MTTKLFSILLASFILVQSFNIHLGDILKLDLLLEHAKLHKTKYGDNFYVFLSKHYGELKEAHKKQHQEEEKNHSHLPINHDCSSQVQSSFLLNLIALNIASIWKLPVIYICENNRYAISAPSSEFIAVDKLEKRAVAYNLPGYAVDGNDVIEVYEKSKIAIENARNGGGPSLLICHTCRQRAHDESDPQIYRNKEDIEKCKRSDPIPRFISKALENNWLTENEMEIIDQNIEKEIANAAEFALNSPLPNPKDALNDVFVEEVNCDE